MDLGALGELTYCTNVHAGVSLSEVRANLATHVTRVKARVAPERSFGVGLWLSATALAELERGSERERFASLLAQHGLYVFTLNGFPYGAFHGTRVKTGVYEPDWRDPRRLAYSNGLAATLATLLPEGASGSVSSLPCGYKPALRDARDVGAVSVQLIEHAARLHQLREATGRTIALALEPEPCCYLETIDEAVTFFERELRSPRALARLAELTGCGTGRAADIVRRHLGLCLDCCHAAVEFEDARELVAKLRAAEIDIAKVQLSCGIALDPGDADARRALASYADDVYLHQVVERHEGALTRYLDLPDALAAYAGGRDREWRVHVHVPVFLERLRSFRSTQAFLRELLALHREEPLTRQLEVETYTWEVLPEEARPLELTHAIARELEFCMAELGITASAR